MRSVVVKKVKASTTYATSVSCRTTAIPNKLSSSNAHAPLKQDMVVIEVGILADGSSDDTRKMSGRCRWRGGRSGGGGIQTGGGSNTTDRRHVLGGIEEISSGA